MTNTMNTDDIALIWKKLHEAERHLKQKNIHQSLISLKDALQKRLETPMLASDQREMDKDISAFQPLLFGSKPFTDVFGPVSFQDNDLSTLLEFILQLIRVQKQDLMETVRADLMPDLDETGGDYDPEIASQAQTVMDLLEQGNLSAAQQLLRKNEKLCLFVANSYNQSGITNRQNGYLDQSIEDYMKALVALPEDEGLYYNIARSRFEQGSLEEAVTAIKIALKINPDFPEGNDLLSYFISKKAGSKKNVG